MLIYPYKKGSKSVKALKAALKIKSVKLEGSRFKESPKKILINWGSTSCPYDYVLNHADAVKIASNKLESFEILQGGVCIPEWTRSQQEASEWLVGGLCKEIVCRTILNSHSGNGIIIARSAEEMVKAPLYVKYIPKKEEYRVHVFKGEAFFTQRKARRMEEENPDWQIRNHKNGFIYANENVEVPEHVEKMAVDSVHLLGLDFGAVDIIWNQKDDKYYVLEVNTAPGLTGKTLEKYVEKFSQLR